MKTFLLSTVLAILLTSCQHEIKNEANSMPVPDKKTENKNLNLSLLLDLSDRIDTLKYPNESMHFYLRDVGYIQTISNSFVNHLKNKKVRTIDDRISLYFDPEPKDPKINAISRDLKFHLTRNNTTLEYLDLINESYSSQPQKIYELALNDGEYLGSDTWSFFKNKVKDYAIEDGYENILIIITDGYMYHVNNKRNIGNMTNYLTPEGVRAMKLNTQDWEQRIIDQGYGFIPADDGLEDLSVLVIGINADTKNAYEEDVIKNYWEKWFHDMGVINYEIRNAELPANMEKIIQDFILKT